MQSLRERFLRFVRGDTLMNLRLATKWWDAVVDALLVDCMKIGVMIVHDGKDISSGVAEAREERRAIAYEVVLLLNITKVGDYACYFVKFLVVVDIPEGIESIVPSNIGVGQYRDERIESDDDESDDEDPPDTDMEVVAHLCRTQKLRKYLEKFPLIVRTANPNPPPTSISDFVTHMIDFKRQFVSDDMLMALRSTTKAWQAVVEKVINEGRRGGGVMVRDGRNISHIAWSIDEGVERDEVIFQDGKVISWKKGDALEERRKLVTRVIFLLNIK
ncbi:hypothetical protein TrLO_g1400 [Triparma laevis f. longispina]|uniref:Uncharacterized protein n=1 Tax=Triparma laevis f. longispina TaxID=1714387 RepID=A0A9W7A783_9STRA|nr:hypothetical protein TrLO_g1400 [Triparma laevis f. longispina]